MEIVQGQIGPEAKYDVQFAAGKLVVGVNYAGAELGAGVSVSLDAVVVIDALEKALPGAVPTAILETVKLGLKSL